MFKITHGIPYFLLGALLAFLLLRGCTEPEPPDTVYIRGKETVTTKYDTIRQVDSVPYPVAAYHYIRVGQDSQPNPCDSVRLYRSRVDTLGASLVITDSVRGVLLRQEVAGTWPVQYITRTDTIRSVLTGRPYRYGLGVLTDGKDFTFTGDMAVTRGIELKAAVNPKREEVRVGLGVRF